MHSTSNVTCSRRTSVRVRGTLMVGSAALRHVLPLRAGHPPPGGSMNREGSFLLGSACGAAFIYAAGTEPPLHLVGLRRSLVRNPRGYRPGRGAPCPRFWDDPGAGLAWRAESVLPANPTRAPGGVRCLGARIRA